MRLYFNDNEPYAAAWLRNLYPDAVVDERGIEALMAADMAPRSHLFAGIGGWEYALELAGWPADRPVWTGSCPCQPFSAAGKRKGVTDERHLWPEFLRLIRECRPPTVFGEQVASGLGRAWLARVRADLEVLGYAVGAADLCAAGVGAPHQRQRLYWVADSGRSGIQRGRERGESGSASIAVAKEAPQRERRGHDVGVRRSTGTVALADREQDDAATARRLHAESGERGADGGVEYTAGDGRIERRAESSGRSPEPRRGTQRVVHADSERRCSGETGSADAADARLAGETYAWSEYDILHMLDGKARRVEPGTFPLAHGVPARVGKLRAYGNAVVPQAAAAFVRAYLGIQAVSAYQEER